MASNACNSNFGNARQGRRMARWLAGCCLVLAWVGAVRLQAYEMPVRLPGGSHELRWPVQVPTGATGLTDSTARDSNRPLFLRFTAVTQTRTDKPVLITLELVNRAGDWYQTARNLRIGFETPRELIVDMAADSADWVPTGHFRPWDAGALDGVTALIFRVSASEPVDLTVTLTEPEWHGGDATVPAAPYVVVAGFDPKRDCWRAHSNAAAGVITVEQNGQADRQAWRLDAFVPGAVAGEWHPVGSRQFAWRPVSGGPSQPSQPSGSSVAAAVRFQIPWESAGMLKSRDVAIRSDWWPQFQATTSIQPLAPKPALSAPTSAPGSRTPAQAVADAPERSADGGEPADVSTQVNGPLPLLAAFSRMHVDGRLFAAATAPDTALTGQPAQWHLYSDGGWKPCDLAAVSALRYGWKAPSFLIDPRAIETQLPHGPRPGFALGVESSGTASTGSPAASGAGGGGGDAATSLLPVRSWLDPRISWAWEEAIAAGHALHSEMPAVVWADRDLYEFGPYRWGLNPWHEAAPSSRTIFGDARLRAMQRAAFDEMLRRFDSPNGVHEWRVALTLPLKGETGIVECYCRPAPPGTRILISHPACMGESDPIWEWHAGNAQWHYPTGWDSLFNPRRYASLAPQVTSDFVVLSADADRAPAGQTAAARLVLHANALSKISDDRFADNLATGAYLDIDLEAVGRGTDGRLAVDIVTGDWLRYHVLSPELLPGNQRKLLRIALGDDSPLTPVQCDLMPGLVEGAADKSAYAWRGWRMRRIREVVVSFFRNDGPVEVRLYSMAIRPTRPGDATAAPTVRSLPTLTTATTESPAAPSQPAVPGTSPAGELLEYDADISPAPVNPYDIEAVDLRLAAVDEKGQTVEVPAFWDEPYQRRTNAITVGGATVQAEAMAPVGVGRFRARLRLRNPGRYQLTWRLYRGSHFESSVTQLHDYRYTEGGVGLPFPHDNYMEKVIHADEQAIADGAPLYGTANANRSVARLTYVTGTVSSTASAGTVVIGPPVHAPIKYVRVSKADPLSFEFDDGSPYYPVGVNARSPSDARVPFKPDKNTLPYDANFFTMLDKRATYQMDDFFQAYAAHGINWARVWMSSWWLALEWRRDFPGYGGVGDYNQIHAARLDHILAEAEKDGVYVQLTLNNHGMYSPEIDTQWADNPYSQALGGPCASMMDFFSQAEAQKAHLTRLRYTAARWGQSPAIHAWEICSEVEFVGEYGPHYADYERGLSGRKAVILDGWHRSVAAWIKQWDVEGQHIVTTHFSHPYQGQSTLALPEMEVPMANAYSAYPDLYDGEDPNNNCQASLAADAYWNGFRDPHSNGKFAGFRQFHKPVLIGEHGRHWMGVDMRYKVGTPNTPANLLADMHCMLWAQYMRPYAGDTGFWWWLPLHFEKGWLDHYAAFAQFIAGEDRRGLNSDGRDGETNRDSVGSMAFYDPTAGRGFAWLFQKSLQQNLQQLMTQSGLKWTFDLKQPGRYEIEFWHTLAPGVAGAPDLGGDAPHAGTENGSRPSDAGPSNGPASGPASGPQSAPAPVLPALKFDTKLIELPAGQTKLELDLPDFKGDLALKIRRVHGGAK